MATVATSAPVTSDAPAATEPAAPPPSPTPLRDLALRGGAYLAGREAAGAVIRLAGVVLVVREIGPTAFGLYSAAAAFVAFAAGLAQMGAEIYLIRSPGQVDERRYHEAFTVLVCTSVAVTAAGIGLTYLVGPWLRPVGVVFPLEILLLTVPLNVLWAPAQARIERQFAYRRMGLLELGGDVALYGTAVPLAFTGAGLWSLVAGFFAWQTWLLVGSLALSGLRPRLAWSRRTAREMAAYGWTYSLSTWISSARRSAGVLIVGTFAGAAGVGFVTFAQRLVTTLNFTRRGVHRVGIAAISRAGLPARDRLSRAMEEGSLLLMLVAAAPFAAFGLVAGWAVPVVFGPAWAPALPVFVILSLVAVLGVPTTVQRTVLVAYGRNLQVAMATAIELVVQVAASLLLVPVAGLVGFGVASGLTLVVTVYTHWAAARHTAVRYRRLVVPVVGLAPPVLAPLLPFPWELVTLVPAVALLLVPPARRELRELVGSLRAALPGRIGAPSGTSGDAVPVRPAVPAPPAVATRPAVATCPTMVAAVPAAVAAVPATPSGAAAPGDRGGDDVRFGGSFNPGMLRLPGGAARPRRAATPDAPPAVVAPDTPPAGTVPDGPPAVVAPTGTASGVMADGAAAEAAPAGNGKGSDPVPAVLAPADEAGGRVSLGTLLARAGRLMGSLHDTGGSLLVGAFEVVGNGHGDAEHSAAVEAAAGALRAELRFDDPVACVGTGLLVLAAPLAPGASGGPATAAHLAAAVGGAVEAATAGRSRGGRGGTEVRHAHVVAGPPFHEEVDQLVRRVVRDTRAHRPTHARPADDRAGPPG